MCLETNLHDGEAPVRVDALDNVLQVGGLEEIPPAAGTLSVAAGVGHGHRLAPHQGVLPGDVTLIVTVSTAASEFSCKNTRVVLSLAHFKKVKINPTLHGVPLVADPRVRLVARQLRHDVGVEEAHLDVDDELDGGDDAAEEHQKLEGHQHGVGDHQAGVLTRPRVEPEEGGEEREHAAEDEEEGHEEEVDGDDLEEVNAVEAHEAGADAHEEEAGHEEGEVDDHVHVAPPVRA